jgi:hypothetical protein
MAVHPTGKIAIPISRWWGPVCVGIEAPTMLVSRMAEQVVR